MPSSVIECMRYEPVERALVIAFRGGRGVYRYYDVPEDEWKAFRQAGSKGSFLNREFKAKRHRFEKVHNSAEVFRGEMNGVDAGSALAWGTAPRRDPG